jgi:hypothetical protein
MGSESDPTGCFAAVTEYPRRLASYADNRGGGAIEQFIQSLELLLEIRFFIHTQKLPQLVNAKKQKKS